MKDATVSFGYARRRKHFIIPENPFKVRWAEYMGVYTPFKKRITIGAQVRILRPKRKFDVITEYATRYAGYTGTLLLDDDSSMPFEIRLEDGHRVWMGRDYVEEIKL